MRSNFEVDDKDLFHNDFDVRDGQEEQKDTMLHLYFNLTPISE
jgi:hypothetical protein